MKYRRCGRSGLLLPAVSLGLWHNFGTYDDYSNAEKIIETAFENGITHFDLANNYGPEPGSAETTFGRILKNSLSQYRDQLIISTKAGYEMWSGPYGNWGSRKSLIASLDQSLKRMGVSYVDIFYSHRPDPDTPLEETMTALHDIVCQGKALYVGISNYNPEQTSAAVKMLRDMGTPCLIHQSRYSMFVRERVEPQLLSLLDEEGVGLIAYSPLAQGLLSNRYLNGIPNDSRATKSKFLHVSDITPEKIDKIRLLNKIAIDRGQTLAEMAVSWLLKDNRVTSVLVGASSPSQIIDNIKAVDNTCFSDAELTNINEILKQ